MPEIFGICQPLVEGAIREKKSTGTIAKYKQMRKYNTGLRCLEILYVLPNNAGVGATFNVHGLQGAYLQPMISCATIACRPNIRIVQPEVRVYGDSRTFEA